MIPLFEPLEVRRLMSTAPMEISLDANGVLTIGNAANVQVHEFINTGSSVQVTSNGGLTNHGTFMGVTQIVINGTAGDDIVTLDDADIRAFISTGNGKDTIFVNNVAPTTITDPDLVTVDAGKGQDSIVATTSGDGTIATIVLSKGTDTVEAPLA
jgi:hypothetical protein